ncbi:Spy/CpxP family protein refolding chaperone [Caulobacter sp. 1776]|uniref:Spy/CpxP family protein refolding chaperone n=1 Tax=Caulobacter sp. 1776 TaxID=3156420 RepID=UPI003394B3DF
MRKTLTRLALAGAAATVLAAGAAVAQVPPPPPAPAAPPAPPMPPMPPMPPIEALMAMGPGMGDMMFMHHGRAADPEKRAQRLRDVLQLRPDQDPALKAYVEATTPKMMVRKEDVSKDKADKLDKPGLDRKDGDRMEWADAKPLTTLERLDRMTKAADAMKQRAEATRAFYTALTPSQQKTFDVLGMGEGPGGDFGGDGDHVFIRRFDARAPIVKDGERRIVIQRKVG